jgi:hypothetical protein
MLRKLIEGTCNVNHMRLTGEGDFVSTEQVPMGGSSARPRRGLSLLNPLPSTTLIDPVLRFEIKGVVLGAAETSGCKLY